MKKVRTINQLQKRRKMNDYSGKVNFCGTYGTLMVKFCNKINTEIEHTHCTLYTGKKRTKVLQFIGKRSKFLVEFREGIKRKKTNYLKVTSLHCKHTCNYYDVKAIGKYVECWVGKNLTRIHFGLSAYI